MPSHLAFNPDPWRHLADGLRKAPIAPVVAVGSLSEAFNAGRSPPEGDDPSIAVHAAEALI